MAPISGSNDRSAAATFLKFGRALAAIVLTLVNLLAVILARAAWPERTITVVAHFAPGGANDLLGRLIAAAANRMCKRRCRLPRHVGNPCVWSCSLSPVGVVGTF
jgi:hypothetical protein